MTNELKLMFLLELCLSSTVVILSNLQQQIFPYCCRSSRIFPCFVKFLKSKDPNDGTEQALLEELKALEELLKPQVRILAICHH